MVTAIKWIGILLGALVAFLAIVGCASIVAALLVRTMQDEPTLDNEKPKTENDENKRVSHRN